MFSTLLDGLIQVSKPLKREIFTTLKDNQDDLNARLVTLEGGANKVQVWSGPVVNATSAASLTGLTYWQAPADFTLLEVKVGIFEKGALTGTLECDVQKSPDRDPANFVSTLTVLPSIAFAGASDYDDSTNSVLDITKQDISQGDWLRFDTTALPANGVLGKWVIVVFGEIN